MWNWSKWVQYDNGVMLRQVMNNKAEYQEAVFIGVPNCKFLKCVFTVLPWVCALQYVGSVLTESESAAKDMTAHFAVPGLSVQLTVSWLDQCFSYSIPQFAPLDHKRSEYVLINHTNHKLQTYRQGPGASRCSINCQQMSQIFRA